MAPGSSKMACAAAGSRCAAIIEQPEAWPRHQAVLPSARATASMASAKVSGSTSGAAEGARQEQAEQPGLGQRRDELAGELAVPLDLVGGARDSRKHDGLHALEDGRGRLTADRTHRFSRSAWACSWWPNLWYRLQHWPGGAPHGPAAPYWSTSVTWSMISLGKVMPSSRRSSG